MPWVLYSWNFVRGHLIRNKAADNYYAKKPFVVISRFLLFLCDSSVVKFTTGVRVIFWNYGDQFFLTGTWLADALYDLSFNFVKKTNLTCSLKFLTFEYWPNQSFSLICSNFGAEYNLILLLQTFIPVILIQQFKSSLNKQLANISI